MSLRSRLRRLSPVNAAPAITMVFVVSLMYRRLLAGRVLAGGDLQLYFYPYWTAVARAFKNANLPTWNPYLFAGAPLLANSQVGLFYPLNWPFWLLTPVTLAGVTRSIHLSVLLHLYLAAFAVYRLARSSGQRRWSAAIAGVVYAGSGFLGTHLEHLNQLQALAWLPLLFLPPLRLRRKRWSLPHALSLAAFAMIVLAGHTQMAFISALALLLWHLGCLFFKTPDALHAVPQPRSIWDFARALSLRVAPYGLSLVVATVQLLPTWELVGLSGRGSGLPWREAVSFSVAPWTLHRALLPPYVTAPLLPEGGAYLGLGGLLLVTLGLVKAARRGDGKALVWSALMGTGLVLALGGYNPLYLALVRLGVPGFAHFRAPARFLAYYVLGASWLAGFAFDEVQDLVSTERRPSRADQDTGERRKRGRNTVRLRLLKSGLGILTWGAVIGELLLSAEFLPHADATISRAYTDLRPATAHLVTATRASPAEDGAPDRFLSMTQTLFEVGDRTEITLSYDALPEDALWSYLVATKQREVLVPNLPLAFQVPAVDGYDGGLLPLRHYINFSKLLLPEGTIDGRLRENLSAIPDERWLSLMGVRFLVTDKTEDTWVDDIFYDRQFQPSLDPEQRLDIGRLPEDFPANALSLLYRGDGGEVAIELADGREIRHRMPPSETDAAPHRLRWPGAEHVEAIAVRATDGPLVLSGASLVDERLGAFYPLVLSELYWLVHSGDVKIYEALSDWPGAFLVPGCRSVGSDLEALSVMRDPAFDPTRTVVLQDPGADGDTLSCSEMATPAIGPGDVSFVEYTPHRVVLDVTVESPAFLVTTDAWYPGWRVRVERLPSSDTPNLGSESRHLYRADILFRALPVDVGRWRITYSYTPILVRVGGVISILGLGLFAVLAFSLKWREEG